MKIFESTYAVILGNGIIDNEEFRLTTDHVTAFDYAVDYFMGKEEAEKLAELTGGKAVKLVLKEDGEEYSPDYKILLHRNNYYKELLLRTEEFLDGLDLDDTKLFKDISKVLEEWE